MKIEKVAQHERAFQITWADQSSTEYPFIWLRDNDPHELHPHTKERTFDLTSVPINISPASSNSDAGELRVRWPDREDNSHYDASWLYAHQPGVSRPDPCNINRIGWTIKDMPEPHRVDAKACERSPQALLDALVLLKTYGIVLIENMDDDPAAGEKFGEMIAFKRETNFGVVFEVMNKAEPNNLAYTSGALPLHTDLANQEFVPGIQFLHCYRNSATGGGSTFSDALAVCEQLKIDYPEYYEILCNTSVPWRFHDSECDVRRRRPVIGLTEAGEFKSLTLNPHLADIPDLPAEQLYDFYAAYQEIMRRTRAPEQKLEYVLQQGEMVIFDNLRLLHGRESFDPASGDRHLRGYYIEHNEVESRIRMLSKE